MKNAKHKFVLLFYFVGLIALSRIIPHPQNFTPVIAMAVFMPYLTRDLYSAIVVPLVAMFVSVSCQLGFLMMIALAFPESLVLFCFAVAFLIQGKI